MKNRYGVVEKNILERFVGTVRELTRNSFTNIINNDLYWKPVSISKRSI